MELTLNTVALEEVSLQTLRVFPLKFSFQNFFVFFNLSASGLTKGPLEVSPYWESQIS